jgi:hypothetical protein
MLQKSNKMEKINRKGIPYKKDADKQTTSVMIRLTEGLKKSIQDAATKENKTVSEMLRDLTLNDKPLKKPVKATVKKAIVKEEVKAVVRKEKKTKKKIAWNGIFGGNRVYQHIIIWHDVKAEVPEDAARSYDRYHEDMHTDGCELLLLVKAKEDGETYLELQKGWYDAKVDRNNIYREKGAEGKVIAYAFVQALEPIRVFNRTEEY